MGYSTILIVLDEIPKARRISYPIEMNTSETNHRNPNLVSALANAWDNAS